MAALQLLRRHVPFKQPQFSSLGWPSKAERCRAEPTMLATINFIFPVDPARLGHGSASHLLQGNLWAIKISDVCTWSLGIKQRGLRLSPT